MYTITGKQKYGAVWANGTCVAIFQNGKAHTNDTDKAEILRKMGYMVTGMPEETASDIGVDSAVSECKPTEEHTAEASEETVLAMEADSTASEGKPQEENTAEILQEKSPKMGVNPKKNTKQKPETE